ncbi:hypothetical protein [Treponema parvum]|uniref:hypothetical protein n=1 Tax=Treponema parvum TaxID=138851 RepID=UPI001AEBCF44|nr:hypothetical protein [Treponema parvum]QTQ15627.1 hypothetical protein HXT04_02310 [Treponema parvum]
MSTVFEKNCQFKKNKDVFLNTQSLPLLAAVTHGRATYKAEISAFKKPMEIPLIR